MLIYDLLECEIFIIDTWNKYSKKRDGMVNMFFNCKFMLGGLLFKKFRKFNEFCSLSKAARMSSTYFE